MGARTGYEATGHGTRVTRPYRLRSGVDKPLALVRLK